MGIQGLLPFLNEFVEEFHLDSLRHKVVGIDASIWLYRGANCCPYQLAMKLPCIEHVKYLVRQVERVLGLGAKPILVFDGCLPIIKREEEARRQERRQTKIAKGQESLTNGKRHDAFKLFRQGVSISHKDHVEAIKRCRALGVECIVAPYESDSQLTLLQKMGLIDFIISEDSDLLVFGDREYTKVLYKIDFEQNSAQLISLSSILRQAEFNNKFYGFDERMFKMMAILAGCDYLKSIKGIGIKKAHSLVKEHRYITVILDKLLSRESSVPHGYLDNVLRSLVNFQHQLVYDPLKFQFCHLNPIADNCLDEETLTGLQSNVGDKDVIDFVLGNISPIDLNKNNYFEQSLVIPPLNVFSIFMFRSQPTLVGLSQHEEVSSPTPYDSGSEEVDVELMDEPCIAYFKVLGTRFQSSMENNLEEAHNYWVTSHDSVTARLQPEPENEKDKDAILVQLDYGSGFNSVGYIAKEVTKYLHPLIKKNTLISVDVKHISFSFMFGLSGHYMALSISKKGKWSKEVIRHSKSTT